MQVAPQPAAAPPAHEEEQVAQQPAAASNPATPPDMQAQADIRNRYSVAAKARPAAAAPRWDRSRSRDSPANRDSVVVADVGAIRAGSTRPSPANLDSVEVAGEGASHGGPPRPLSPAYLLVPPLPAPQWRPALAATPWLPLPPPPPAPRAQEEVLPAPDAGLQGRPAKAPRLDQTPDKGTGKDRGKDRNKDKSIDKGKSKGTGKDKGKTKGDTQKSDGYGKSPIGKDKQSNKAAPYAVRRRTLVQHGLELIPSDDEGDWAYNPRSECRQFWSSQYRDWIRGTWEEQTDELPLRAAAVLYRNTTQLVSTQLSRLSFLLFSNR